MARLSGKSAQPKEQESRVLMNKAAFWRELLIRCGPMVIVAAVAHLILHAEPWVWLIPLAVAAMVFLKRIFSLRDREPDANEDASREQDSLWR